MYRFISSFNIFFFYSDLIKTFEIIYGQYPLSIQQPQLDTLVPEWEVAEPGAALAGLGSLVPVIVGVGMITNRH